MSNKVTQRKKEKPKWSSSSEVSPRKRNGGNLISKWLPFFLVTFFTIIGIYFVLKPSSPQSSRLEGLNFIKRWGTFRSGVYFGLKRNDPSSMVSGLMWFKNILNEDNSVPIRHLCEKFDPVEYIWRKHDFDSFGVQQITDGDLSLKQQVLFREDGWVTRITVNSSNSLEKFSSPVSLILYLATENAADTIQVSTPKSEFLNGLKIGLEGSLSSGTRQFLSRVDFSDPSAIIHITDFKMNMNPPLMFFNERIMQNLGIMRTSENSRPLFVLHESETTSQGKPNFVAIQFIVNKPIELFFYLRESIDPYIDSWKNRFDADLMEKTFQFDTNFDNVFALSERNYNDAQINFAQSVLSNMLGSIGYFYGYSLIKNGSTTKPERYGPLELTTAVPSRSYFPRGFLWDEGFHQLLIAKVKPQLSREIIKNWLYLMDPNGWIPREVILGYEATSRVPKEFIIQDVSNANPPSLLLPIEFLFDSNQLDVNYLKIIFPLLENWFNWFNTTQVGTKTGTYRWRGRDPKVTDKLNPLTLTSGLDDYPRASHPSSSEIHLDLRCWMTLASRILFKIGKYIEAPSAVKYEETFNFLRDNRLLDATHWSQENQMYCDYGVHTNSIELVRVEGHVKRVVKEKPSYRCVQELGYISLFPMLLNLLDADNPRLNSIMDAIESPDHLWTPYGLRSISRQSRYYLRWNTFTDPPYWRGPIWININFLVLKSLKHYSKLDGPYRERAASLHDKLRDNLVNNVFNQYESTSFIWEHYNDTTGVGGGVHPFTGWSALVLLIMSDKY